MPLLNHPTFGDIQNFVYLKGKVLKVYLEDALTAEALWDTADIEYENKKIFYNAAIRYHCTPVGVDRANGAIVDGGRGFDVGDNVILMAKIGSAAGQGEEYTKMYVVGHVGGVVRCTYNYLLIRMSRRDLLPHSPPYGKWIDGEYVPNVRDSHLYEYCTVWDAAKGTVATIYTPVTKEPYAFPVTVEEFKPALDYYQFVDEELFMLDAQGDEQSQEAGFVPDWRSDVQGEKIRQGAAANTWWTTYDIFANPIYELMWRLQMSLASDSDGAANGTFQATMDRWNAAAEKVASWKAVSPGAFNDDTRLFPVKGSGESRQMDPATQVRLQELQATIAQMNDVMGTLDSAKIARWENLTALVAADTNVSNEIKAELVTLSTNRAVVLYQRYKGIRDTAQAEINSILGKSAFTPWTYAHDKNLVTLQGTSYHMQFAYGEDEIWVCAKNVYRGIVVSYCDEMWKFVRLTFMPPALAIGNPALDSLAGGGSYFLGGAGAAMGTGKLIEDVSFAMAASITQSGDNNIFSYATLKRINDGGFHRTSHPALRTTGVGSWRLTQNAIPGTPLEPTFISAMNTRQETIDIWNRYDNWMNSIGCSYASYGVDRTWWFKSNAQQWRMKSTFIDTPIGSMWHTSPTWEVALWMMTGFRIFDGGPTCRRDAPMKTHFIRQTKHSKRVVTQIYIAQRQAVTMWDDPSRTFVIQQPNKGIYDHFDPADTKYVAKDKDGINNDDYNTLTDEQKQALISDRVFLRSEYPGEVGYAPPMALRNNRNEVEIMAACDLYSALKTEKGRCHPNDQVRRGLLEFEIQKLIAKYYADEGLGAKDLSEFKLEARIV